MKRALRPAFLVTVSAIAVGACNKSQPVGNPPPEPHGNPPFEPSATVTPTTAPPPPPTVHGNPPAFVVRSLNPQDVEGRIVFFGGAKCYVELPFKPGTLVPPGSPPPRKDVPCPDAFKDAAWKACQQGTIQTRGRDTECNCIRMGNPPPPPQKIACPKVEDTGP